MRQERESSGDDAGRHDGGDPGKGEDQIAATPLDGPFAPALLLLALALWRAYDGWWNRAAWARGWEWVNGGVVAVLGLLAVTFLVRGFRVWRAGR